MNKIKMRILGSIIIIICLCLPKICIAVEDYYDFHQVTSIDGDLQDIIEKHPLISNIYQYAYTSEQSEIEDYSVKKIQSYSKEEQETIKNMQSIYGQEIQELIDREILSTEILENDNQPYQVTFGTLTHEIKNNNQRYILNQIYRINTDNDKIIDFTMDQQTHKIIDFSIRQKKPNNLSQEEIKNLLWLMLDYLELDDIGDWSFLQNSYESYKAKLRITYQNELMDDMQVWSIQLNTLYSSPSSIYITFQ